MTEVSTRVSSQLLAKSRTLPKLATLWIAIVAAIGLAWDGNAVVRAEEFNCTGTVGGVSLDNIFVPDGQSCVLNGTRVDGNLIVGTGATLHANSVTVGGNIQAEGATNVTVNGSSHIGGNIQIEQGGAATVEWARVEGDIQLESNRAPLRADNNVLGGNLQVFSNTGGVILRSNSMEGNLQCQSNSPAPTGGNNIADNLEDQCADLSMSVTSEDFTHTIYLPGIR